MNLLRRLMARPEFIILTLLALITRLWEVTSVHSVVFDEVYFKVYAGDYLTGSYYFDPHPPLGKELLGAWAWLTHIPASALVSTTTATPSLRVLPALAGAAIIPVFYLLLRQLRASRRVATLGAALLLLDNALLVESRFVLIDSMLVLFGMGALTAYLAARRHKGAARWWLLGLASFLAGLCGSTKWTGLAILGLIGFAWFVELPDLRTAWRRWILEGLMLMIIPAIVYLSVFWVHFQLLPNTGQGDAFMPVKFQQTIVGNANYNPNVHISFWEKFVDLNREMSASEASLKTATHPYGSKWYTWPLEIRGVYYWAGDVDAHGNQGNIYLLGNPAVWWGILVGIFTVLALWPSVRGRLRHYRWALLLLFTGYIFNYLPFSRIVRVMFLYHYFFALCFSLALAVMMVGAAMNWMGNDDDFWHFSSRTSMAIYLGILIVAIAGFVYFAPLSYGWGLSPAGLQHHMWLKTWR